jgi:hypothetical protein
MAMKVYPTQAKFSANCRKKFHVVKTYSPASEKKSRAAGLPLGAC